MLLTPAHNAEVSYLAWGLQKWAILKFFFDKLATTDTLDH